MAVVKAGENGALSSSAVEDAIAVILRPCPSGPYNTSPTCTSVPNRLLAPNILVSPKLKVLVAVPAMVELAMPKTWSWAKGVVVPMPK